jgi:uncharacterized protein
MPKIILPDEAHQKSVPSRSALFFKTKQFHYVFVPNTGHIHRIASIPVTFDIDEKKRAAICNRLDCRSVAYVKNGYSKEEVSEAVNKRLAHMTLEVTEECNLRCSYCVFSGKFKELRSHSEVSMTEETALKACDYFIKHLSQDQKDLFFTFYGGEPLLNFPVIVKTHQYLTSILKERIQFSLTTNGTLLDRAVRAFLVSNNIHLTISLDGDRQTHNRYRRFANGLPSFDHVMQNIEKLRSENEAYFKLYVTFAVTVNAESDYRVMDEFFSRYQNNIKISGVMFYGSNGIEPVRGNTKNMPYLVRKFTEGCLTHAFDHPGKKYHYKFSADVIAKGVKMIHNRELADEGHVLPDTLPLDKHCIPGATKLFVTPDGTLYPCEKLDSYNHLAIGNLDAGVNSTKVFSDLEAYAELRNQFCRDCFLVHICTSCFQSASNGARWDREKMTLYCNCAREEFTKAFTLYTDILEQDESALDFLDNQRLQKKLTINYNQKGGEHG